MSRSRSKFSDLIMGTLKLTCILLILCSVTISVKCLFEDQAGTYDWRQQFVGRPLSSHIDLTTKKFFVATDQNLVGALNIKNGNIAWRKMFESNDLGKIDFVLWGSTEIVVITGDGQRVQSFNYNNGFANWEYVLFNRKANKKFNGIESKKEKGVFYLTDGKQICNVGFKEKICVDLPIDGGYVYETVYESVSEINKGLFIIGYKDKFIQEIQYTHSLSSIVEKTVSLQNGNLKWIRTDTTKCIKSADQDILTCYSPEDNKLYLQKPSDNQLDFTSLDLPAEFNGQTCQLVWTENNKFLIESPGFKLTLLKLQSNQLLPVMSVDAIDAYKLKSMEKESFLVYVKQIDSELTFTAVSLTNENKPEHLVKASNPNPETSLLSLDVNLVVSKSGQFGMLTMCFFSDYTMSLFNTQGVSYFSREEALAYISSVEMLDFPLSHLQEELEDEFSTSQQDNIVDMLIKRIRTQIVQVKEYITIDMYQKVVGLLNANGPNKKPVKSNNAQAIVSADELVRDEFNLNKVIVVATTVGKVYGIYTSANGQILWSFYLPNALPFQLATSKPFVSLFLQRSASHVHHEPQAVFVSNSRTSPNESLVFHFNPLTGQPAKQNSKDGIILNYSVKQAFLGPNLDSTFLKPLIMLDHSNKMYALPDIDPLINSQNKLSVIYTVGTSKEDTVLTGLAMSYSNEELAELWKVRIEGESVQAIASIQAHDKIHSHGKVLGDRSVLYKYLNPSLIGVVTSGEDGQRIPFVNVYLIDTVTGAIVQSFNHKKAKGPVNIVHSENWFFYSYYNIKNRRFEVTSVELFEGSQQFNSTRFSSLDDIRPIVFSKSYVVQKAFNAMQVTLTEKGITTKNVVVACQSGIIIDIPWILIDPRRPLKMTEVEKEENLLPYMPEIPLNYEFSLNYYNYVYNVRGITTSPSGLESTSLVFVYGLDIYFTRVFPSKTFDLLREDFDYLFVSTLMFGLLIGTILAKKLASSSNLQKAWK